MKNQDFLPFQPRKLISLWGMVSFCAIETHDMVWRLICGAVEIRQDIKNLGADSKITQDENLELIKFNGEVKEFCKKLELENSFARAETFGCQLAKRVFYNTAIETEIIGLRESIIEELNNRYCAFIPCKNLHFFENEMLFGLQVQFSFSEACQDIKDAGNCIAADLNTAAVFHLMRVVEHGLRALASKLKVKVAGGKPIEDATWGQIIRELHKKIDTLYNKTGKTFQEDADLDFYRLALNDCNIFKPFRDAAMHTRRDYSKGEAQALCSRVEEFMQRLVAQGVKRPPKAIAGLLRCAK
jgi:hypothetical protein